MITFSIFSEHFPSAVVGWMTSESSVQSRDEGGLRYLVRPYKALNSIVNLTGNQWKEATTDEIGW